MGVAEIHHELFAIVYGKNIMSEGTVRQWCRMFKGGQTVFMMKNKMVGWPSVVSDDLIQSVDQTISDSTS
jgi:hypothetical protein